MTKTTHPNMQGVNMEALKSHGRIVGYQRNGGRQHGHVLSVLVEKDDRAMVCDPAGHVVMSFGVGSGKHKQAIMDHDFAD